MASRSGYHQQQQQQQWSVLKCPRCESSNTKFCYYNNYSLSQPRHFCKACKRYWTRGGTLRNVPVGGSCRRKNKLARKPSCSVRSGLAGPPSSSVPTTVSFAINPQPDQIIDTSSSSTVNHMKIPSFYGLPSNPYSIELPHALSSRSDSNVNVDTLLRFNHLNDLGGLPYPSGFDSTFPDVVSNSNPLLFSSSLTPLLLHPQKLVNDGHSLQQVPNHFHSLLPFGNQLQTHQQGNVPYQTSNENDQISLSDPSPCWNSTTVTSVWHDPADFGFSDSSLI